MTEKKTYYFKNKRAYFDYEIISEFTAGIALVGSEVKSLRMMGSVNFNGAYCYLDGNNVKVKSMSISEFKNAVVQHDPLRERQLLLNQHEINKIKKNLEVQGVTLIPLKLSTGPKIKLTIGLAKGKKLYDKRQTIKERDIDRDLKRKNI